MRPFRFLFAFWKKPLGPFTPSFYFRPDGVSTYLRPDGVSTYQRPIGR